MGRHRWMHRWHAGLEGAWGLDQAGSGNRFDSGPHGRDWSPIGGASPADGDPLIANGGRSAQFHPTTNRNFSQAHLFNPPGDMTLFCANEGTMSTANFRGLIGPYNAASGQRGWTLGYTGTSFVMRHSTDGLSGTIHDLSLANPAGGTAGTVRTVARHSVSRGQKELLILDSAGSVTHSANASITLPIHAASGTVTRLGYTGTSSDNFYPRRIDETAVWFRDLPNFELRLANLFATIFGFRRLGYA